MASGAYERPPSEKPDRLKAVPTPQSAPIDANQLAVKRTDLADERTDLAIERTIMAANRTMMAWMRTGLSLISFGFTIYKFLQAEYSQAAAAEATVRLMKAQGPQRFGLTLIAMGVAAVVLGGIENYRTVKHLNSLTDANYKTLNFSFVLGSLVGLLGLFLFLTIVTNSDFF